MSQYIEEVNKYLIKIKHGDKSQEALKELFDFTFNHLKIVAKVYLRNKSYVEDVVVEAFQKAYKYIDSFDGHKDGYNWLCKITQMIAYNYNERSYNAINIDDLQIRSKDYKDVEENIDLFIALNSLDIESKKIIILYFYMGYTFEEIGNKFGKGKAAIYKQVQRIIKRLKSLIIITE